MTGYILHRAADEDLVCGAHYIRRDNPDAVHIYRVLHGATNWQEDLRLFG